MKRVFAFLLLALILCGCAAEQSGETTADTRETLPAAEPTEPTGCYLPGSSQETDSGGAVRAYKPDLEDAYALAVMGSDVVIFSGTETTTLTKLTGENRYITAELNPGIWIDPESPSVAVTEKGMFYYDTQRCELVQLGVGLKEINRISFPEEPVGEPVISPDRKRVCYCTANHAWELTLETGIHRMIKEIGETFTTALGLRLDSTVLQCRIEGGTQMFLSVENGKTLWQGSDGIALSGAGQTWCAKVPEGIAEAYVFGNADGVQGMLLPEAFRATGWYLEQQNRLVLLTGEGMSALDCYDLDTGRRISRLTPGAQVLDVAEENGFLWVLTAEGLLCWDPAGLPSGDDRVYSTPRYTVENTDEDGFASCEELAAEIGSRYGVEIHFGLDALAVQPVDYDLTGEYLVPVILAELEALDRLLAVYPEGMLARAVTETTGGTLHICIVREVRGSAELGIPGTVGGTHFRDGEDSRVVLAVGQSNGEWYHQIYHALETRLMSNSKACYDWEYLNPEGFDYDYSYLLNQNRVDEGWLEGENRYFIDLYSMSFPMEDRARIMEYAMLEGCGDYFASDAMQAKLQALCAGIREAYGLKKSPETFLWEQYLKEPLAYKK